MISKPRKHVTKEEKEKEAEILAFLFGKLLENLDAVVMVVDEDGHIVFANLKYLDFFCLSEKDVIGEDWLENIVPENKHSSVKKVFETVKAKEKLMQFDAPVLGVGNMEKQMCWSVAPLMCHPKCLYMFMGAEGQCIFSPSVRVHSSTPKKIKEERRRIVDLLFEASTRCEPETAKHAKRTIIFAEALAKKVKLSDQRVENLVTATLLHDLGKLAVDSKILFKKGKLDKMEFEEIKKHLNWGADVLRLINFLKDVVTIMCSHHENYDGRGYPVGIRGEKIPIEARILSIADIYEALTADRPYRKAFSEEEAVAILEYEKGHKLDPRLTDVFIDMVKNGEVKE